MTVGASIVSNALTGNVIPYRNLPELEEKLKAGELDKEELLAKLLDFVSKDPKRASAELNTCLDLLEEGRGRQQYVYLLHSDTEVGKLCAGILRDYLVKISRESYGRKIAVRAPIQIKRLGDQERFGEGLANLFERVVMITKRHKEEGDVVFIHATGGFKPETAVAVMAANLPVVGAPVFYLHEHFKKIVRLPAMPVMLRRWGPFERFMNLLCERKEILFEQLPLLKFERETVDEAIRLGWAEEVENKVRLSPMGELFWKKLRKFIFKRRGP